MADEYGNRNGKEFNPQVENRAIKENLSVFENKTIKENIPVKENLSDDHKKESSPHKLNTEKHNRALSVMSTGVVAAVGLALAGITSFVNVKMKASFVDAETKYEAGVLSYSVNVEEMTEDETLTIYVIRDNVQIDAISLIDEDGDGVVSGYIPEVKEYVEEKFATSDNVRVDYFLKLKGVVGLGVERAFDEFDISIQKETAKFEKIEVECHCSEDGCFHFLMTFSDINGNVFTDFEAYIEDDYGNKSYCKFTDNLHEEQKIYVLNLKGSHGKFVVKYKADAGVENKSGAKYEDGYYILSTEINM